MSDERTPQEQSREQLREFRRIVADAVGELRSQEIRNSFASLSLEELADQHVARLAEDSNQLRPSRLRRLRKVRDELANTLQAMKDTPPESFRRSDPQDDANTPPDDDEDEE
jgi:(p)ppGpp synthase/HD superfamily hydrolase